jgi:hypothetical protein
MHAPANIPLFGANSLNPMAAPIPANEAQRLEALRALNLLDSAPEERFDRITRLAARVLNVPMACVVLVDDKRGFFKSRYGIDIPEISRRTPSAPTRSWKISRWSFPTRKSTSVSRTTLA